MPSILLLEDDADFAASITGVLRSADYRVDWAQRLSEALPLIKAGSYDAVLSDINLPDSNDLEILEKLRSGKTPPPVILMTGASTFDRAVQATLRGAFDYLRKPVERLQLLAVVGKAVASHALRTATLPEDADPEDAEAIVGQGPAMLQLFKEIGRVARQRTPVLLLGETGTGKELVARAIHRYGGFRAKNRPFVPINCAAIPETLVESELFGHEKGTFTGAQARRIGRFHEADGGIVFLDEIGELPLPAQAKLLRVLQEREVQPLGGTAVKIDVLVVAATHRNLEEEIRAGRFREDLYFRLNLATLSLPPLRERREDIPHLVAHFLRRHAAGGGTPTAITTEALLQLQEQPWPGNVRELENVVKRASMLTSNGIIGPDQVHAALLKAGTGSKLSAEDRGSALEAFIEGYLQDSAKDPATSLPLFDELERRAIAVALRLTKGQKIQAAKILGINRKTLREKIVTYGLQDDGADEG